MLKRFLGRPSPDLKSNASDPTYRGPNELGAEALDRDQGYWTSDQWGLAWLADTYVLGSSGLFPKLPTAAALRSWNRYRVDQGGQLTPREFQRVMLFALVLAGESFNQRGEAGRLIPRGKPFRIDFDDETNLPIEYEWQYNRTPPVVLPASQVIHSFVRTRPGQRRGDDLYELVQDIAAERRGFIFAVIKLAKMASLLRLFHKRGSGNMLMGQETTQVDPEEQVTVDFTRDGITRIGPRDEIISPNISAGPIRIMDVERAAGGAIGKPYGISRMQASRDYSDTSYSSARYAGLIDAATWERYQLVILGVMEEVFAGWPGRAEFGISDPTGIEWVLPRFPSVDPQKDAMVDKVYIELGVRSRQQVIRRFGGDPNEVFQEIDEYEARRAPAGGNPDP